MITRKTKKKEIKEDVFVEFFVEAREYAKKHQNHLFIALIAVVVIGSGIVWYSNNLESSRIEGRDRFSEALSYYRVGDISSAEDIFKLVKNDHSNTREGVYAIYFLGKCVMDNGHNKEAISLFRDYIKNGKYPLYNEAARVAMAVAFENERDFKSAAEIYMNLVPEMASSRKKANYLEKAAKSYEFDGKKGRAIEVLEKAIKLEEGLAKREIELRISILKG